MRFQILLASLLSSADAFAPTSPSRNNAVSSSSLQMAALLGDIVIVSPPGGVGEVAAVESACLGSAVRWFVVSDETSASVKLAPETLQQIQDASGTLELAGATVEDLKLGGDALAAVSKWCGSASGLICTYDGCGEGGEEGSVDYDLQVEYISALRLAAQQAATGISGPKVAILAADQDLDTDGKEEEDSVFSKVSGMFRDSPKIPPTLERALMGGDSDTNSKSSKICVLRHGELFGIPESSPDFSPLIGGPKREPVLAEEYTMRNLRIDPFVYSGNTMGSTSSRSCRHVMGKAAALLVTGTIPIPNYPVSLSSQLGSDAWDLVQWKTEFERVQFQVASGKGSELFTQAMIVSDTERLADWLATKWAPAVMRTYDIAAIRIGARPVFASRTNLEPGQVEIVWQKLVDYESVLVGKLILSVTKEGVSATRGAGDASKGFGNISTKSLPGEDVLVRRLAEACSQAVDKGLAKKVRYVYVYYIHGFVRMPVDTHWYNVLYPFHSNNMMFLLLLYYYAYGF
jgi:hypothetical protein